MCYNNGNNTLLLSYPDYARYAEDQRGGDSNHGQLDGYFQRPVQPTEGVG